MARNRCSEPVKQMNDLREHHPAVPLTLSARILFIMMIWIATTFLAAADPAAPCPGEEEMRISSPRKIGIGIWETDDTGRSMELLRRLGVHWYYTWSVDPLAGHDLRKDPEFVPMIWGAETEAEFASELRTVRRATAKHLLAFNEPNRPRQSAISVEQALAYWPRLIASGKRLGSPAAAQGATLGEGRWLTRFMDAVSSRSEEPDFVAVHFYSRTRDVESLRRFLERVHSRYGKPIWVTEWGLVHGETWRDGIARFTLEEAACFFRAGAALMDDLPFVERHAWFAAFDGGDGWHLNTHAVSDDGTLTPVGASMVEAAQGR